MGTRQLELSTRDSHSLPLAGASVTYYPDFFPANAADQYFDQLQAGLEWQQFPIFLFGRRLLQPRLIAWYGEPGLTYSYSGNNFIARGWLEPLNEIRQVLQQRLGISFNAVLCNRYRDGRDSMGWHSDDEIELGARPMIASVSLGATRQFRLREKNNKSHSVRLELSHGSVLLMGGDTQKNWQHCLPKTTRLYEERINLTFRRLPSSDN